MCRGGGFALWSQISVWHTPLVLRKQIVPIGARLPFWSNSANQRMQMRPATCLFLENRFKICWICKVIVSGRRYTLGGLLWQLECRIADGAHVQCPSVPGSRWSAIRLLTHVPYVTKAKCHPLFMKADKPRTFFYSPEFFHEMKTTNEICSFRVNLGTKLSFHETNSFLRTVLSDVIPMDIIR